MFAGDDIWFPGGLEDTYLSRYPSMNTAIMKLSIFVDTPPGESLNVLSARLSAGPKAGSTMPAAD